MVGALFYLFCFIIVMEQLKAEKKERVLSQLDLTVKFNGVGEIWETDFRVRPRVWCFLIIFVPVVRVLVGILYLVAIARGSRTKDWFLTKI